MIEVLFLARDRQAGDERRDAVVVEGLLKKATSRTPPNKRPLHALALPTMRRRIIGWR